MIAATCSRKVTCSGTTSSADSVHAAANTNTLMNTAGVKPHRLDRGPPRRVRSPRRGSVKVIPLHVNGIVPAGTGAIRRASSTAAPRPAKLEPLYASSVVFPRTRSGCIRVRSISAASAYGIHRRKSVFRVGKHRLAPPSPGPGEWGRGFTRGCSRPRPDDSGPFLWHALPWIQGPGAGCGRGAVLTARQAFSCFSMII
jgi:hypothetical protein